MILVVDTSVIAKLFLPEEYSAAVLRFAAAGHELHAPEHMAAEFGNTLWKSVRSGSISASDASELALSFARVDITYHSLPPLLSIALDIAIRFDRTVYDSLYVALALHEDCQLITADRRLYNSIQPAYPATMLWIEDLPDAPR